MNKTRFVLLALLLAALTTVAVVAQHYHRTGPPIDKVAMLVLNTEQLSSQQSDDLAYAVRQQTGVTACSINNSSQKISVVYHPDQTDATQLQQLIDRHTTTKVFDMSQFKSGCPVSGIDAWFYDLFN